MVTATAGLRPLRTLPSLLARRCLLAACAPPPRARRPRPERPSPRHAGLPRRARRPRRCTAGRPRPRLRGHQGRRPGEARGLADRARPRGHRHRGCPAVFDAAGGGLLALRLAGRRRRCCPTAPPADRGLAINSEAGRAQNLLHIHISCVLPEVRDALADAAIGPRLGSRSRSSRLGGDVYNVRRVAALEPSPFLLLARAPRRPRRHGRAVAGGDRRAPTAASTSSPTRPSPASSPRPRRCSTRPAADGAGFDAHRARAHAAGGDRRIVRCRVDQPRVLVPRAVCGSPGGASRVRGRAGGRASCA